MLPDPPPIALTIAGSDCSAGAGLQADLKAFHGCGAHGLCVVTSVVAETPHEVAQIEPQKVDLVLRQYDLLVDAFPIAALKTGLLATAEIVESLRSRLDRFAGPIVIDPVSVASTGASLAGADYDRALRTLAMGRASLLTPNRIEAEALLGRPLRLASEARDGTARLADELSCPVLLKGGHFEGPEAVDWLVTEQGLTTISRERLPGGALHGTGCAYSAAITAYLAHGFPLERSIEDARTDLQDAIRRSHHWMGPSGRAVKALAHGPSRVQN